MAETTDVVPETPTPTIEQIALQIKSLEQRTTSVTISRSASVLDLKQEIKLAFDVDSDRQRLIFQGRVLKDDKQLTDYANLDNGKVIHLVIRPIDAPHNPLNDDPNPGTRHTFNRGGSSGPRSRIFPSISSRLPMMEGYAFITLDSNISDIGDSQSLLSSVLNGFAMNSHSRNSSGGRQSSSDASNNNNNSNNTRNTPRNPFAFSFGRGAHSEFASPLAAAAAAATATATNNDNRGAAGLPFPPSVEVRLARTLGSMRNVRAMLDDPTSNDDTRQSSTMPNSTPEQLQDIRNRLRNSGTNQSAQIGMVLNELVDLMTEAAPRMRQVAESLSQENRTPEEERNTNRRVLNMSRIVQGMSLINHFLGSVLASADIDNTTTTSTNNRRHHTPNPPSSSPRRPSLVRLPSSLIYQRGNTEAIRTATPLPVRATNNNNNSTVSSGRSQLSTHTTTTAEEASSSKRKLDEATSSKENEEQDANKKQKNEKGKDKTD